MSIKPVQPVHPDDYVSDITVDIGLALRNLLEKQYPGRIRARLRDSPLATMPGHTILVSSTTALNTTEEFTTTEGAAARMLPILIRELRQQLGDAGILETAEGWDFAYTWDGHGLFGDGQFVYDGFRFDAYLEVFTH